MAKAALAGCLLLVSWTAASAVGADDASKGPASFRGSASAIGVEATVVVPGAPATDTPVDGGGPTAQAALDSLGTSTGYAAFPDPGGLVVSAPGLVTGLLSTGAGGLPPVKLPTLPSYPFYVQSDAASAPSASAGAGPYALSADSAASSSRASATGGFQSGLTGNASLVTANVSVIETATAVTATATSDAQALTIGPLVIGEVKSTAAETLEADGTTTPATTMEISGMKVAGVGVSVSPTGMNLAGPIVPVPLNASLASLLKSAGVTLEIQAAQRFPDRVVAPSLRITAPLKYANVGHGPGTMTVTVGASTAALSSAVAGAPGSGVPASTGADVSGDTVTPGGPGLAGIASATGTGGTSAGAALTGSLPATGSPFSPTVAPAAATRARPSFDIRSFYLLFMCGALIALAVGQLIRFLGVRQRWTSIGG